MRFRSTRGPGDGAPAKVWIRLLVKIFVPAFLQVAAAAVIAAMAAGSLLNLSHHPHWFIRGWDFPRLQIVVLTAAMAILFLGAQATGDLAPPWAVWTTVAVAAVTIAWHMSWIWRFAPVAPRSVKSTPAQKRDDKSRVRLIATNVEKENPRRELWQEVIRDADADLVLALEVNDDWIAATRAFQEQYEHRVIQIQDNYYGMMLLSRLPLRDPEVRFIVEDDVPSIHATLVLPGGAEIRLHCVHPRPPEPLNDVDSNQRDAELVVLGREIAEEEAPAIVCGDLNDVAWSRTTRLFLKLSRMLDPREGRGLYNTWHARYGMIRFPLDHVFHTREFTLRELRRLDAVGSDHFPILADLQYTPELRDRQHPPEKEQNTEEEAQEIVDQKRENSDRPIHSDQQDR